MGHLVPVTNRNERPSAYRWLAPAARQLTPRERENRQGHRGGVVWFTGLSGSGKSTLARTLERELYEDGARVFVLDGDSMRRGLCADLGFSPEDRSEQARRVAEMAALLAANGVLVIVALITPYQQDRVRARQIVEKAGCDIPFLEVYLSTPLDTCEARDPKQLYMRARAGELRDFTGVSAPFEPPLQPDLAIDTSEIEVDDAIAHLLERLQPVLKR